MRLVRRFNRKLRETRMFVRAMQSGSHPILAQIVPIRRCNLDCAYCNEYDKTSAPVPLETMLRRIDRLADLGTTIITLSGGEPTLHPDLDAIIRRSEKLLPESSIVAAVWILIFALRPWSECCRGSFWTRAGEDSSEN
jgi:sulfatase maturation enzyme AslB (radical SAM superfamily)